MTDRLQNQLTLDIHRQFNICVEAEILYRLAHLNTNIKLYLKQMTKSWKQAHLTYGT